MSLNRQQILSSSVVGFEFEFYSEFKPKEVSKQLSQILGKRIVIPTDNYSAASEKDKSKKEKILEKKVEKLGKGGNKVEPTASMFKLVKDFSGGQYMHELITGPLVYEESRIVLIEVLKWIKEFGWTDSKCSLHINMSFNSYLQKFPVDISTLVPLKFALNFDEEYVYARFPERRDNVYAKSIMEIYPTNRFVFFSEPENIDPENYVVPKEKYYGFNFTKLADDYLEMRYVGGKGYEKKLLSIQEIMDYTILKIYDSLANPAITDIEKKKLHRKLNAQKRQIDTFVSAEKFLVSYPRIEITVDLKSDVEILKTYWTTIREKLFSLIVNGKMKSGEVNFDTDFSALQVRDASVKGDHHLDNLELFDCEIMGTVTDCLLFRCVVKDSRITSSKMYSGNEIKSCKIENSSVKEGTILTDCYIDSPGKVIDCEIVGGVFRRGVLGENADVSPETLRFNFTTYTSYDKKEDKI
jgi:hypothetical protein